MSDSESALPPPEPEPSERRDMALFVRRDLEKFLPIYDTLAAGRNAFSVCWPGLVFPQAWFLYRKMYGWAAFACVTPLLVTSIHGIGGYWKILAYSPALAAISGRRLYVGAARRTIARIRAAEPDAAAAEEVIRRAGGVSIAGAVIGALFFIAAVSVGSRTGVYIGLKTTP